MYQHSALPLPAVSPAEQREQGTTYEPPRSIISRVLFDLGLCRSGSHFHKDPSARAMCCDGFRFERCYIRFDNGPLKEVVAWRSIDAGDMLFPWESHSPPPLKEVVAWRAIDAGDMLFPGESHSPPRTLDPLDAPAEEWG